MELNKIYNMDCLEGLKQLEDNSIDLVLTDPPYGLDIAKNGYVGGENATKPTNYGIQDWDSSIPSAEYFKEIMRVSKNQIIFGGNYFLDYLGKTKCFIVWDKGRRETNFADCELAWTSFDKPTRIFKYTWDGMRQESMKFKEKRIHPTQKPLKLGLWILDKFSAEGDIILDTHIGSGTFMVASQQLNRQYLGFDISKEYCDMAKKRLIQEPLFKPEQLTLSHNDKKEMNK